MDVATKLFARNGYEATTTAAIAEAAGVTEPILYRHFEGKQDLSGSRGELVYELYGSKPSARHTIVKGDVNGDGDYDFLIVLKGHHALHASDFIL